MHGRVRWSKVALLVVVLGVGSAPAWAQKTTFGISGGIFQPAEKETDKAEVFGMRAAYEFKPHFTTEAALSWSDLSDTLPPADEAEPGDIPFSIDFSLQLLNLDLSVQWYPKGGPFVVFGGAGMSRLEARVSGDLFGQKFLESDVSNIFTANAGVGYEWALGEHLFLRPEARYRYLFDDNSLNQTEGFAVIYDASGPEALLVLGWRLGS